VAALAGVSRTTVSFVLNDRPETHISPATRARVLAAAAQLGYRPHASARGLAVGRSQSLGLVLRQTAEQVAEDALLAATLRGIADAARAEGYQVLLEPLAPGDGGYGDLLRSHRADGLIISGPRAGDDDELAALAEAGAAVVIQGSLDGVRFPCVDVDNVAGARQAVEHLVTLGHRVIGHVTNAPRPYTAARERRAGYAAVLADAGIAPDDDLVVEAAFSAASGRRAMAALLRARPDLTAVFVASDVVAFGAIAAIRDAGRGVPDDVSVVGFDDIPLAAFSDPPLTTVHVPAFELGRSAGVALLDRIHGRRGITRTVLPIELVLRSSTTRPGSGTRRARDGPGSRTERGGGDGAEPDEGPSPSP
jgi:DNA-binding LacI/PurR family transcriptional regulator